MTDIKLAAHGTSTDAGNGDWRHNAACLTEDPELFFPIGKTGPAVLQIEKAKAVCRRCEVSEDCLRWALDTGQDSGVWGNLSEDERRSLKRKNARTRRATEFATPHIDREPRGTFVPAEPTWTILADARDRGWTPKQTAAVVGCHPDSVSSILARLGENVVHHATALKVAAADLSGPPPAETQTAVRR